MRSRFANAKSEEGTLLDQTPEPAARDGQEIELARAAPHWWAVAQRLIPLTLIGVIVFIVTVAQGSAQIHR
jgi:hypothetical protein